jgi:hypothetical protein
VSSVVELVVGIPKGIQRPGVSKDRSHGVPSLFL